MDRCLRNPGANLLEGRAVGRQAAIARAQDQVDVLRTLRDDIGDLRLTQGSKLRVAWLAQTPQGRPGVMVGS